MAKRRNRTLESEIYNPLFTRGWQDNKDRDEKQISLSYLRTQARNLSRSTLQDRAYYDGYMSYLDMADGFDTYGTQHAKKLNLQLA